MSFLWVYLDQSQLQVSCPPFFFPFCVHRLGSSGALLGKPQNGATPQSTQTLHPHFHCWQSELPNQTIPKLSNILTISEFHSLQPKEDCKGVSVLNVHLIPSCFLLSNLHQHCWSSVGRPLCWLSRVWVPLLQSWCFQPLPSYIV